MKELSKYILENVNKHNDNIYSCTTIDGNACTFYKKDIIECLESIYNKNGKLTSIKVTAWDELNPRTKTYKYIGRNNNELEFKATDDIDFVNDNIYKKLIDDLNKMDDVITVKFDKCKYIQTMMLDYNEFFKDGYTMTFEG